MRNLFIVIGREYATRVKKKSFIILTILMPFLIVGIVLAPMLLGSVKDNEERPVAVLDQTGKYVQLFIDAQKTDSTKAEGYVFAPADRPLEQYNTEEPIVNAVIYIDDDIAKNPDGVKIYSQGEVQADLRRYTEDLLTTQVRKDKLAKYQIAELDSIIDDVQKDLSIQTVKWTEDGEETFSSSEIAMVLGLLSSLMIYMFVIIYGAMVMQGVMEEKTNRIVEVIVGSVRPFDLMMGKIIGIMLVGFTQMLVWGAMILSISMIAGISLMPDPAAMASQQAAAMEMAQQQPLNELSAALASLPLTQIVILFVLYFLGGYILYSSFYAAIGAAVNSQEDSSQFMMPMMIMMIFAMYAAMGSMENTDGPLAFWTSLFPLTSPVVMMVRLPFGVPAWQIILSVALLFATALLFVWVSARIYRVGILMYGKKPSVKEMIKWMRYK